MLWIVMLIGAGVGAWKMADAEHRQRARWATGTTLAGFVIGFAPGWTGFCSPAIAFVGAFALMWWLKLRDPRPRGY